MTTRSETFLEKWKELEIAVIQYSKPNNNLYEYEQRKEDEAEKRKLQLCRIMRNYISHGEGGFCEPTEEMIRFLDGEIDKLKSTQTTAEEKMVKVRPLTKDMNILDIAMALFRFPQVPVVDDNNRVVGIITESTLKNMIIEKRENSTVGDITDLYERPPVTVAPFFRWVGLKGKYIVTRNGRWDSEYLGFVEGGAK